ncbi:MAG: hypothetical protein V1646_03340, partial [bacterium]
MNKKLSLFAFIFLGVLSSNIFCMCQVETPDLDFSPADLFFALPDLAPDLAFVPPSQLDKPVNLDEINFDNIYSIICGINFDFNFFKKIVSMYCCSKLSYLSNSEEWMGSEKHKCPFSANYDKFSKKCKKLISRKFAQESPLHEIFYAQKLFINKTAKLITISDLHADFDALRLIFNNMHNSGSIDDNLIIKGDNFLIG